jgi:hypothetical protein
MQHSNNSNRLRLKPRPLRQNQRQPLRWHRHNL